MTGYRDAILAQAAVEATEGLRLRIDRSGDEELPRLCEIVAHTLWYEGGAAVEPAADERAGWQAWLALAAWGHAQVGFGRFARTEALLAAVYPDIAALLPERVELPLDPDFHALAHVLGLSAQDSPPAVPDKQRLADVDAGFDELLLDDYYGILAHGIVAGDWERCTEAFTVLAADVDTVRERWNPEFAPGYERVPAALAIVARDRGMDLGMLDAHTRRWLWPAVVSRPHVRPQMWPPRS